MPFSTYLPEQMGTFGIDDTGMVKISWRTTSDMSKPQFDKPRQQRLLIE
jgi:hypothetical protein